MKRYIMAAEPFGVMGKTKFYTSRTIPIEDEKDAERIREHVRRIATEDVKRTKVTDAQWDKAREWYEIARELVDKKCKIPHDKKLLRSFLKWDLPIPDCGAEWVDAMCISLIEARMIRTAARATAAANTTRRG